MAYLSATLRPAFSERFHGLGQRLRDAAARRSLYNTTVRELSVLNDRDLNDIGIARMQIRNVARKHAYGL